MINTTLCYLEKDGCYLMLYRNKKKNDLNAGKWIGIGGKFEPGETAEQCLLREVKEEVGVQLTSFAYRGLVHFRPDNGYDEDMYLFTADGFDGALTECNEGETAWIEKSKVFDLNLWEGDRIFLKKLLLGESGFEITLEYIGDQCVKVIEK